MNKLLRIAALLFLLATSGMTITLMTSCVAASPERQEIRQETRTSERTENRMERRRDAID